MSVNLDELQALYERATQGQWGQCDPVNIHLVTAGMDATGAYTYCDADADAKLTVALHNAFPALRDEVIALRQALSQILGWRELRDSNAFPVERVEAIARAALQSTAAKAEPSAFDTLPDDYETGDY